MTSSELNNLLHAYSSGELDLLALEECSGLWCGEILILLAKQGLPLPRVDSVADLCAAQRALYGEIFT